MPGSLYNSRPSSSGRTRRIAVIAGVALVVLVPGALLGWYFTKNLRRARVSQAPAVSLPSGEAPGVANPLSSFDLRHVLSGAERVKLWTTPPGAPVAYGVEFVAKTGLRPPELRPAEAGQLWAVISRRGTAEHTAVPMAPAWIDHLNEAVRRPPPPARDRAFIPADLYVERPGDVPGKYAVRFDAEGVGWAVIEEILSHYGLSIYIVKAGDNPAKIAQKILGDSRRWPEILAMNPGLKPDKLKPGDALHVPKR